MYVCVGWCACMYVMHVGYGQYVCRHVMCFYVMVYMYVCAFVFMYVFYVTLCMICMYVISGMCIMTVIRFYMYVLCVLCARYIPYIHTNTYVLTHLQYIHNLRTDITRIRKRNNKRMHTEQTRTYIT